MWGDAKLFVLQRESYTDFHEKHFLRKKKCCVNQYLKLKDFFKYLLKKLDLSKAFYPTLLLIIPITNRKITQRWKNVYLNLEK
jgi:hypothetical protein